MARWVSCTLEVVLRHLIIESERLRFSYFLCFMFQNKRHQFLRDLINEKNASIKVDKHSHLWDDNWLKSAQLTQMMAISEQNFLWCKMWLMIGTKCYPSLFRRSLVWACRVFNYLPSFDTHILIARVSRSSSRLLDVLWTPTSETISH